jgi:hypothetical protein
MTGISKTTRKNNKSQKPKLESKIQKKWKIGFVIGTMLGGLPMSEAVRQ